MKIAFVLAAISSLFTFTPLASDYQAAKNEPEPKREYQLVMRGDLAACYLTAMDERAQIGRSVTTTSVVVQQVGDGVLHVTHTSHPTKEDRIVTVAAYVKESEIQRKQVDAGDQGYSKTGENNEVEVEEESKMKLLIQLSSLNQAQVRTWKLETTQGELAPPR